MDKGIKHQEPEHAALPGLSVIIPTLNEADSLLSTLQSIQSDPDAVEILVVDGGSRDDTVSIAESHGCHVIHSDRAQRARQLNFGVSAAKASVLLFLHADTRLPERGCFRIVESMKDPGVAGGGFVRAFDSPSRFLKFVCWLAKWRGRMLGYFIGDQAMFVRRSVFEQLGGFDENYSSCEDLDFSHRLRKAKAGKIVTLEGPVMTSARRFEKRGPLRQWLEDLRATRKYFSER